MAQLPPPNRIANDLYLLRMNKFFEIHPNEHGRIEAHQVTEMFELYNDKLLPRETGRSCGGCRLRVYRRLLAHYQTIKTTE